ncbi:hypothetical protein [Nonomuraea sp. NEAU-A123]|uniref:hypothetical protein n=1 Tax=Nonomuraea sp. NEAU-A123 TaxID=2839649 RepID=UPI001BE3DFF7|nr:hypothetical protein [Nonomuraea sp. NEAU-A123]MBT2230450.1 hypothetical protein [Nonomuraea sp. NEAU-A123]
MDIVVYSFKCEIQPQSLNRSWHLRSPIALIPGRCRPDAAADTTPGEISQRRDGRPEHATRAAELSARENGCCSFFTFTLTIADGGMTLEAAVPPEQVAVLDALQARASAASA